MSMYASTQLNNTLLSNPIKLLISAYSPEKLNTSLDLSQGDRTKQSFKEDCDINVIMSRYLKTGVFDFVSKYQGQYLDCTGADYQAAMDTVVQANEMFAALPSHLREQFDNDPEQFVSYCSDPSNRDGMAEMGLLQPSAIPTPQPGSTEPQNAVKSVADPAKIPASI